MGKRILRLVWVIAAAFALRACVVEPIRLTDDSMSPVVGDGEVALVSKLRYGLRVPGAGVMLLEWSAPKKGDLVAAVTVGDPPTSLMRRISAVPGEKLAGPDGKELQLKDDEYYLLAEHAEGVVDSRVFGPVNRKLIIGKVTHLWMPKNPSKEGGSQVESESSWRLLQPIL